MIRPIAILLTAAALVLPAAAIAATGTVNADLRLRAGPGTNYRVLATIPKGAPVEIDGCVEAATWCRVSYDGTTGYSSGQYLTITQGSQTIVVTQRPSLVRTVVAAPIEAAAGAVGAVTNVVLGVADAAVNAIDPSPQVTIYVQDNPVQPVYVTNEVVIGAIVPETIELYPVPGEAYTYTNINGELVLVEPTNRQVIYIYSL